MLAVEGRTLRMTGWITRRQIIFGAALLAGAACLMLTFRLFAGSASVSPLVGFAQPDLDLGTQKWKTTLDAVLTFRIESEHSVRIARVASSCGCTLVHGENDFENLEVGPNESIPIKLTMETGSKAGRKEAFIKLLLSDGTERRAKVYADVVGTWRLSADQVDFGSVSLTTDDGPIHSVEFHSDNDRLDGEPTVN